MTVGWIPHELHGLDPPLSHFEQAMDVDNDGDIDVVYEVGGCCEPGEPGEPGEIVWHENVDGQFLDPATLLKFEKEVEVLIIADVGQDGDFDLLVLEKNSNRIDWYANSSGSFIISGSVETVVGAGEIRAADVDGDGDSDLIVTARSADQWEIVWHENRGAATFGAASSIYTSTQYDDPTSESWLGYWEVADLDGDSDLDVVLSTSQPDEIASTGLWLRNEGGEFSVAQSLFVPMPESTRLSGLAAIPRNASGAAVVATFTQPGKIDVYLSDQHGQFSVSESLLPDELYDLASPMAADMDGDEDLDIVVQSSSGTFILQNNNGSFSPTKIAPAQVYHARVLAIADSDNDGDQDLLMKTPNYAELFWRTNQGTGAGFVKQDPLLLNPAAKIRNVVIEDVDGDADLDVLYAGDDGIGWYSNDGLASFVSQPTLLLERDLTRSYLGFIDFDNDADLDFVYSSYEDGDAFFEEAFFENVGGQFFELPPEQWPASWEAILDEVKNRDLFAKVTADIDGDGELDSLSDGPWGQQMGFRFLVPADLDGDGDQDVLNFGDAGILSSALNSLVWYENRRLGDANDNGTVEFADFLALSANFGKQTDAVWEDGDFNADGTVSFADFLLLSQNFGLQTIDKSVPS